MTQILRASGDPLFTYQKTDDEKWPYEVLTAPSGMAFPCDTRTVKHPYFELVHGVLSIKKGYRWNGASGPAIDDQTIGRASCFHDVVYQMLEDGWLEGAGMRKQGDKLYRVIMLQDGAPWWRAAYHYWTLRTFGGLYAR